MAIVHVLDENSNAEMATLLSYFADVAVMANAGILIMHHLSKGQKGGAFAARGASSIVASVRSSWELAQPDLTDAAKKSKINQNAIALVCTKSNRYANGPTRFFSRRQVELAGECVPQKNRIAFPLERRDNSQ